MRKFPISFGASTIFNNSLLGRRGFEKRSSSREEEAKQSKEEEKEEEEGPEISAGLRILPPSFS